MTAVNKECERLCIGEKPIGQCEAAKIAMRGAVGWFANPSPDTAGLLMDGDYYVLPYDGEADCQSCQRTVKVGLGIQRPQTSAELYEGPYTPTEQVRFTFPAINVAD